MPNQLTPEQIAEAQRIKAALATKAKRLEARKVNLQKAISELPDDVSGEDLDGFTIDLKRTEAELNTAKNRLGDIESADKVAEVKAAAEDRSGLVETYDDAQSANEFKNLSPAVRQRAAKAKHDEGMRRLFSD